MSRDILDLLIEINQLRKENKKLDYLYHSALDDYIKQFKELQLYKKALDKACDELEKWDINNFDGVIVTKEQWKEWCMKYGK